MKRRILTGAIVAAAALQLRAQDIHFTQFTQTPLNINPASAGLFEGFYRGSIHYRNQWASMGHAFNTMAASFDMPFGVRKRKSAYFGAGTFIYTDKAGDAGLGTTQANICGSGIVPLSPYMKISAGLNLAFSQQSFKMSSLQFGNQFSGNTFDPSLSSGESSREKYSFFDAGAGVCFQYNSSRSNITRDDIKKITFGASAYHLNMPRQSFYSTAGDKLHIRYVGHMDVRMDIPATKFSALSSALFMMQGPNMEIDFGVGARYRMKNGTKVTGNSSESAIAMGVHYRFQDAIMPQVYYETGNFAFGVSYDLNVSSYKEISHMNGGFEISIKYTNLINGMFDKGI
jgi:type IX secretion system PorP/SprF family membrane protein